jgi:hypothetical protein
MPEISAEEAMRATCDAIMQGDIMRAMMDFTPDALNQAMALGAGLTAAPSLTGYTIDSHDQQGGEHRFGVRFGTTNGDLRALATWREVDGAWKITAISVEGLGQTQ